MVFNFSQYIQDNIEEAISGVKGANSVKILGPNLGDARELADQVRDEMSQVRGVTDLGIFPVLGQPNLNIKIDRDKAARYGLNTGDINTVIQAALGGTLATTVLEGDRAVRPGGALSAAVPRQHRQDPQHQGRLPDGERWQRLRAAERARDDLARHRRLVDLPRKPRSASSR